MMTAILYAHPYDGSFNHALLTEIVEKLKSQGKSFEVMDLYADGFNPALEASSLRLYSRGETADPLVERYLKILLEADEMIMVFPIWWGMMPAMVKGFFDKVMLTGKAYLYNAEGELVPDRVDIKRTVMVTTSQADTERFRPFFIDYFKPLVLEAVGMKNLEWYNCPQTAHGPQENRTAFYQKIYSEV
ncbi:MAG: NAD(P)H-dependent oxidoreductase [Muribaculaceae bacterium]|nr:NAD(P)H-dependent oxidoreductase [Muribaculaceae bacterium]